MGRGVIILGATVFAWLACGGRTVGGPDGGPGSGSSSGAQAPGDAEGPPVTCNPGAAGGSSGGNSCSVLATETCSDGNMYRVDCSCPARMCTCGVSGSGSGGSVFNTAYAGCPGCTETTMLWAICGFPGQ